MQLNDMTKLFIMHASSYVISIFKFYFSPVTGIIISALNALKLLADRASVCAGVCVSDVNDLSAPGDNSKYKQNDYNYNLRIVFQKQFANLFGK